MIVGDGLIPEVRAFYDVRDFLKIDHPVILASHLAPVVGITIRGQVIYNMEPLYDGCRSFSLRYLETLQNNVVLDYCSKNVEYLSSLGVNAFHLPYGYHGALYRPISNRHTRNFSYFILKRKAREHTIYVKLAYSGPAY